MGVVAGQQCEFRWGHPQWQPPSGSGLVAVVPVGEATRGWECLLACADGVHYVWLGLGSDPEHHAWEIATARGATMACLAVGPTDVRQIDLALQVAGWLFRRRAIPGAKGSTLPGVCLTASSRPALPEGKVRIPHLVSVRRGPKVQDTVVWELADRALAREHAHMPANPGVFESHLKTLLTLRSAVRERRLPMTPLARRLLDLLDANGGDLSIELVYANATLFHSLLDWWDTPWMRCWHGD